MHEDDEQFPRVRDLPKEEQEDFNNWLAYQGRPLPIGYEKLPSKEWDWYYPQDYVSWVKYGKPKERNGFCH